MKKFAPPFVILTLAVSFFLSQWPASTRSELRFETAGQAISSRAVAFSVSRPVSEMENPPIGVQRNSKDLPVREIGNGYDFFGPPASARDADASLVEFGTTPMPQTSLSIPGLANIDNANIYSLLIIPPDMNGDVGPDHYVQIVNSLFRVFNKSGQPMSPPLRISSLFESLGTVCSTRNDGLACSCLRSARRSLADQPDMHGISALQANAGRFENRRSAWPVLQL